MRTVSRINRSEIYNLHDSPPSNGRSILREPATIEAGAIAIPELDHVERVHCSIRPESRIVTPSNGDSAVLEQLRLFDHRLAQFRALQPFKRVLVTSATPGEGKTVVSINLAITVASSLPRVLLIDSDIRRGSVAPTLGIERKEGLAEVLKGERTLAEAMCFVEHLNFYLLTSGVPGRGSELLNSPAARDLFQRVGQYFDFVIVDSCPVLPFSDAHKLADLTDAILIVVRNNVTNRTELEEVVSLLSSYRLLGIVLNGSIDEAERSYQYYKHYHGK